MAHDIAGLQRKLRALHKTLRKFHEARHSEQLLSIIRKPGWTSVPEAELVHLYIDNLQNQVGDLHNSFDKLVAISGKIGPK
jgi:hypothetical protein